MRARWVRIVLLAALACALLSAPASMALLAPAAGAATPAPAGTSAPAPTPSQPALTIAAPPPTLTIPLAAPAPAPLATATSPFPNLSPPVIDLPTETEPVPQMQAALLADVNAERAAAGLGALTTQPWAQGVALAHAQVMAAARTIWHNYTGFVDVAKQTVDAYVNGENVGMALTLPQVDAALMASPEHRANILYPLFNEVGIGVAQDIVGYVYVVEDFVDIRPATRTAVRTVAGAAPAAAASDAAVPSSTSGEPATPAAVPLVDAAGSSPLPAPSPSPATPASSVGSGARAIAPSQRAAGRPVSGTKQESRMTAGLLVAALIIASAGAATLRKHRSSQQSQAGPPRPGNPAARIPEPR